MELALVIGILTLVGVLVGQQIFWMQHTQKLVDKIMSGNYTTYVQSQPRALPERNKADLIPDPQEDLGILTGIQTGF